MYRAGLLLFEECGIVQIMPTAPRARGAENQLSADSRTQNRGSVWSLSSPPASHRIISAAGAAGGAGRLPALDEPDDGWIDVVHTLFKSVY